MSKYNDEEAARRIDLYVEFLKRTYRTDERGLADLCNIPRATWTRNRKARIGQMGAGYIVKLAALTGISPTWLLAEGVE